MGHVEATSAKLKISILQTDCIYFSSFSVQNIVANQNNSPWLMRIFIPITCLLHTALTL